MSSTTISNETKTTLSIKLLLNEEFREITMPCNLQLRYAISNHGRLVSFSNHPHNGRILKGSMTEGYRIMNFKCRDSKNKLKNKHLLLFRLVADKFLTKTSEEQIFVLHLDYNKANDRVDNLRWATKEEHQAHIMKSPYVIESKKNQSERQRKMDGTKLTETQVMFLKKVLLNPERKTKIKILAKQFGVTPITLYRIKSGENWGHIEV